MNKFNVSGMNCAACSARVERAVNKVPGVTSCAVSLLTNSMGVEGTASPQEIIAAVEKAGYGAVAVEEKAGSKKTTVGEMGGPQSQPSVNGAADPLEDRETPHLIKRLVASLAFLLPLMYFSMGTMMWGWPMPKWFEGNHVAMGLLQLVLTVVIMVVNQEFFTRGFKGIIQRAPNMDSLVAIGAMASFLWSVFVLFLMTDAQVRGDGEMVMEHMDSFYFESAAMILTLITVGKLLEARSKGKTTNALKGLMKLAPKVARVIRDGEELEIPVEQILPGEIFVVRPGENIPVDGVIVEGSGAINEAALTGESIPTDKKEGDNVSAGTVNSHGFLKCQALRVGEDTTLSQIIKMVSDAAATKAPIAKIADKVSGVFVPVVMVIAALAVAGWLIAGESIGFALAKGISVLVISCPCALGLATPVAIMVGNGVGAKSGILFKTALSLEQTGRVSIVALDKTGTITEGNPVVTDIYPAEGIGEEELLIKAISLEAKSEHPLAKAVLKRSEELGLKPEEITNFQAVAGNGLKGKRGKNLLLGGNMSYISSFVNIDDKTAEKAAALSEEGKTPMFFAEEGRLLGIIAVADVIKEDSPEAIRELQNMGIKVVMLTGDNEKTANAIGKLAGVDQVVAGVLPDGKEQVIKELKAQGKVAMVGDGINDAPALTRADIGIAIGAGTDVAIDAADVVLMKSRLTDGVKAIKLSKATLRNIHENLFWAFFYNVLGIPLAAGLLIPVFGLSLSPMFGAMAMSLSSFCVVTNALRLNGFKYKPAKKNS